MEDDWLYVECSRCGNRFYVRRPEGFRGEELLTRCETCEATRMVYVIESSIESETKRRGGRKLGMRDLIYILRSTPYLLLGLSGIMLGFFISYLSWHVRKIDLVMLGILVMLISSYLTYDLVAPS